MDLSQRGFTRHWLTSNIVLDAIGETWFRRPPGSLVPGGCLRQHQQRLPLARACPRAIDTLATEDAGDPQVVLHFPGCTRSGPVLDLYITS